MSKVVIRSDGQGRGIVSVDGVEMNDIRHVSVSIGAGDINTVTITFLAETIIVDACADVHTVKEPAP